MRAHFAEYAGHGWALCNIKPGTKGPAGREWNKPHNTVRSPQGAANMHGGAGLVHEHSGTCAIDVDDLDGSRGRFAAYGVDIDALLGAPDAVRIDSKRPNRAKLLYRTPELLPTHKVQGDGGVLFELRCKGVQDVLPPTKHPDTGQPYEWRGNWRELPQLPSELQTLWRTLGVSATASTAKPRGASMDKLRAVMNAIPAAKLGSYDNWLRVGMALHFETDGSGEALALWNEASAQADKYDGYDALAQRWDGFRRKEGSSSHVATLSTLEAMADQGSDAWRAAMTLEFDIITPEAGAEADAAIYAAQRPRFELVPFAEFVKRPAPLWLVDDLLPLGCVSMLWGASGSGKSFLAVDIALSVAAGTPWRGLHVRQQRVVYVAAEGAFGIAQRMRACAQHRAIDPAALPLLSLPQSINLFKGDDWRTLTEAIKRTEGAGLIIIDTLAQVTTGANENSGEDMQVVLNHCQRLQAATGATLMLVHHQGKDAALGERGWSGMRAALDASLQVVRPAGCDIRELRVSKMKEGEDGGRFAFRLERVSMGTNDRGRELSTCIVVHEAPAALVQAREPRGRWQSIAWKELHAMLPLEGGAVSLGELIGRAAARESVDPESGKPDRRREYAKRAIDGLRDQGLIVVADDRVSIATAADDFTTAEHAADGLL